MEERKEETKKGTEGRLVVGMAVAVLVVILCLMLDGTPWRRGIGGDCGRQFPAPHAQRPLCR